MTHSFISFWNATLRGLSLKETPSPYRCFVLLYFLSAFATFWNCTFSLCMFWLSVEHVWFSLNSKLHKSKGVVYFISVSPVLSRVPDTGRYSVNICWVSEWMNECQHHWYMLVEKYKRRVNTFLLSIGGLTITKWLGWLFSIMQSISEQCFSKSCYICYGNANPFCIISFLGLL